jgi:asparagine synthase (glutamine-hydrolysing)
MQYIDQLLYLPDDLLHKVDRASMATGLEVRVPLLDHNVIETSWRFPNSFNLRKGKGKQPLKHLLAKHLPKELIDRPKMGFGVPVHDWLRGPLKEWASDLLSHDRLEKQNMFFPEVINSVWKTHLSGKENLQEKLWGFLMLQAWLDKNT